MDKYQKRLIEETKKAIELGNSKFSRGKIKFEDIDIRFTLRGKTAGRAQYNHITGEMALLYHPTLMNRNLEEYIKQVVNHEVAHLYQRKVYPHSKPHGREFKYFARGLGDDGSRCHSLDTTGVGKLKTRYVYKCENGHEATFTKGQHENQQIYLKGNRWHRHYTCRRCHGSFEWTGQVKKFR